MPALLRSASSIKDWRTTSAIFVALAGRCVVGVEHNARHQKK